MPQLLDFKSTAIKTMAVILSGFAMGAMFFLYESQGAEIFATLMIQGLANCF